MGGSVVGGGPPLTLTTPLKGSPIHSFGGGLTLTRGSGLPTSGTVEEEEGPGGGPDLAGLVPPDLGQSFL